ncbi:MAG: M1 family aminopeptidase, partial [Anaerolineales bacterium]
IYLFSSQDSDRLPILTAHEVSHQWWYSAVGNDVFLEPWLDEALAQYSALVFLEEMEGEEAMQRYLRDYEEDIDRLEVLHGTSFPVGSSVWEFAPNGENYYEVIYYKGPMFLHALRLEIGDEAFFSGMRKPCNGHPAGICVILWKNGLGRLEADLAGDDRSRSVSVL